MRVVVSDSDGNVVGYTQTDAVGAFEVSELYSGTYSVDLSTDQGVSLDQFTVVIATGEPKQVTKRKLSVEGQAAGKVLMPDGQPAAKTPVTLFQGTRELLTTTTDSDGIFTFGILYPGNYAIAIDGSKSGAIYDVRTVEFPAAHATNVLTFAPGNHSVAGRLVDTNGLNVKDAVVTIQSIDNAGRYQQFARVPTNVKGEFAFSGVPSGEYILRSGNANFASSKAILVDEDVTDIELMLSKAFALTGTVTLGDKVPANAALVHLRLSGSSDVLSAGITDEDGFYVFDGVPPGEYEVHFFHSQASIGRYTIEVSAMEAELNAVLATTPSKINGRATGIVDYKSITVVAKDAFGRFVASTEASSGEFQFDNLPTERLFISATGPGFSSGEVLVDLTAGAEHKTVTLEASLRAVAGISLIASSAVPSSTLPNVSSSGPAIAALSVFPAWLRDALADFPRLQNEPMRPEAPDPDCPDPHFRAYDKAVAAIDVMNDFYDLIGMRQDDLQHTAASNLGLAILQATKLASDGILFLSSLGKYHALFRAFNATEVLVNIISLAGSVIDSAQSLYRSIQSGEDPPTFRSRAAELSNLITQLGEAAAESRIRQSMGLKSPHDFTVNDARAPWKTLGKFFGALALVQGLVETASSAAGAVSNIASAHEQLLSAVKSYEDFAERARQRVDMYNQLEPCTDREEAECTASGGVSYEFICAAGNFFYNTRITVVGVSDNCDGGRSRASNGSGSGSGSGVSRSDPFESSPRYRLPGTACSAVGVASASAMAINSEASSAPLGALTAQEDICAQVTVAIDQSAVQTRDAFEASLTIVNDTAASPLIDLNVDIIIFDANGAIANDLFLVRDPLVMGAGKVDGTGVIQSGTAGDASWIIIPSIAAAPMGVTEYFVGGTISYGQGGLRVNIDLTPVRIDVVPGPELQLKYFLERDVYADDPFTPEIEPSLPFSLGVLVTNTGAGVARNLAIESAQPRITENSKGLDTRFTIEGTEINGQARTPSLNVTFGDINPGETMVGQWILTTPLQGHFIDFDARYIHEESEVSGVDISLIRGVETFETVRVVYAGGEFDDGLPDFLTDELVDDERLPDTLHLSDGSVMEVGLGTNALFSGVPTLANLRVEVTAQMTTGWSYLRMDDPSQGEFLLIGVERSDGTRVPSQNFWQTDRTFRSQGQRPVWENKLHLLDYDSTGAYTFIFSNGDIVGPEVISFAGVSPNPTKQVIDVIEVTFTEPLHDATFTESALHLTKNSEAVELVGMSIERVGESTYCSGSAEQLADSVC